MRNATLARLMIASIALSCVATAAQAGPYVPPSLAPGSTYHLVFISQGTRDGTSSLIADYNNFVQAEAALNLALTGTNVGVVYKAIASTTAIDANVNVLISAPVYNFNGDLIATSLADFWDGTLANAILYDQFAAAGFPDVWSGSDQSGTAVVGSEMGSANPRTGLANLGNSRWIDDTVNNDFIPASLYGVSQQLTVVPEPSTALLLGLGLVVMTARRGVGA